MSEELEKFYKGRGKNSALFDYDDDGNLVEKNKQGEVVKTIALPDYRPPTFEEFDEMEKERMEKIAVAEKEFEDVRRELRSILERPDVVDSEVLILNRKVKEADAKLQSIRFPLHILLQKEGVEICDLDFNQPNEKRKYPFPIGIYTVRPFTLQDQYVRIGKAAEKPLVSVAEAKAAEDMATPVILFAEPETNDYGFLSLKWVVDIEFNSTMYHSAWQAIAAQIAKAFNDEANLNNIMTAETPDAIDYSVEDVPGDKDINETKWADLTKQLLYDINLAKFNQYPELAARLLETRSAQLGAYVPDDNLIGIGISLDNIQSKNPVNWTGQNLLGKALMDIRNKIRTEKEVAAQALAPAAPIKPRKRPTAAAAAPEEAVGPRVPRRKPVVAQAAQSEAVAAPSDIAEESTE